MRSIVTDGVAWSVRLSVCHDREPRENETPFGLWIRVGLRQHVLDGCTFWRNLANTIKLSMCCGDAAFFPSYFDHLL